MWAVLLTPDLLFAQGLTALEQAAILERTRLLDCRWTERVLTCTPGEVSQENLKRAVERINLFRVMVGLDTVSLDPALNEKAQLAAFVCQANMKLQHHAELGWRCYSATADSSLAQSNLRFFERLKKQGRREVEPAVGFIEDLGTKNNALGHRRWLLYSQLSFVGYGATERVEAIYVEFPSPDELRSSEIEWIAYPPAGEVIDKLVFSKWSFGIPVKRTDFSTATVTMTTEDGKSIRLRKLRPVGSYGDPTLVWEVASMFQRTREGTRVRKEFMNKLITIRIAGVDVDGSVKDYVYSTRIVSLK